MEGGFVEAGEGKRIEQEGTEETERGGNIKRRTSREG